MADDISRSSTPRLFLPGVLHNVVYNNIPGCPDLTAIDRETLSVHGAQTHTDVRPHIVGERVTNVEACSATHIDNNHDDIRDRRIGPAM